MECSWQCRRTWRLLGHVQQCYIQDIWHYEALKRVIQNPLKVLRSVLESSRIKLPVNSLTWMANHLSLFPSFLTISDARAFIGALRWRRYSWVVKLRGVVTYTYIILNLSRWICEAIGEWAFSRSRYWFRTFNIVSMATSVLPFKSISGMASYISAFTYSTSWSY